MKKGYPGVTCQKNGCEVTAFDYTNMEAKKIKQVFIEFSTSLRERFKKSVYFCPEHFEEFSQNYSLSP